MVNKYDNYELKKVNSLENVPGTIKDGDGYIWDPSELPDKDFDDSKVPLEFRRLAIWMRSKLFGKDVRETIARLAEMFGLNFKELMDSFESLDEGLRNTITVNFKSLMASFESLDDRQGSVESFMVDFIQSATDVEVNSGPEIVQARGVWDTLGQRLDDATSQLTQNTNSLTKRQNFRPIMTIESDDSFLEDYTHLYPFLKERGVPGTVGVPSGSVGATGRMTLEQLKELHREGWTIASHTITEAKLKEVTIGEAERQLRESKKELEDMLGFAVDHFTYPSGSMNNAVANRAKKYYKSSRTVSWGVNEPPMKSQWLFGIMSLNERGIDYIKEYIDQAYENGGWVIVYVHGNEFAGRGWGGEDIGLGMRENLDEIIAYAKSKNFTFLNREDAWNEIGNPIDVGHYGNNVEEDNFVVSTRGDIVLNSKLIVPSDISIQKSALTEDIKSNTPLTYFKKNSITYSQITSEKSTGFPENRAGTLITHNVIEYGGYPYQEYHIFNANKVYRRNWEGSYWGQFELLNVVRKAPSSIDVQITVTTTVDKFSKNQITYNQIASQQSTGFPENKAGTLITHYLIEWGGYPYQEYHLTNENKIYRRVWTGNTSGWGNFELVMQPIT